VPITQQKNIHHYTPLPDEPAPIMETGVLGWLKSNLFSTWGNTLTTIITCYIAYSLLAPFFSWAIINADWVGSHRDDCSSSGACWVFIYVRLEQFIYGFYPSAEQWRVNIVFAMLAATLVALAFERIGYKKYTAIFAFTAFPVISFYLLVGGAFGLEKVDTHQWGGLMLTLILAVIGIVAALPFGVLLALGRRAKLPVIRSLCTVFIEVWRGVPLITVLFMASVMLPLFMSHGAETDKLMRALIGIIMFQSAYMAEVVRGGLQAIPKGQYEAAEALGLNYAKQMGLIILPQALKIMIPGIVNTFIALFKDTSLVLIIGLFDLLAIVQSALADPKWLGYSIEGYLFVALVFWVFCFSMSRYSQNLEQKLNTGY